MGCPHHCVFCNQFKITGKWHIPDTAHLEKMAIEWFESSGKIPELAFYGGSFTAIEDHIQIPLLKSAYALKKHGLINGIRLSTRPDALDESALERLERYKVDTIEIGVQSLDEEVLHLSERGHSAETTLDAIERVKAKGIQCGVQLMIGLPGDTPEKSIKTCEQILKKSPSCVRLYPTMVIKDTPLEKSYLSGSYIPWDFETLVETTAYMAELIQEKNIPIIRIGLQSEENLMLGKDIVAGAYHPAFGEYVLSRIFRHKMIDLFLDEERQEVVFKVHPKCYSQAIGQHRENIRFLESYIEQSVKIIKDEAIQYGMVKRG